MNTPNPRASASIEAALAGLPAAFRGKISSSYVALKSDALEARHATAGLNVGKFCEACLRFIQHEVLGTHAPFGKQIPNFADECRKIITANAPSVDESIRVLVPRALVFAYTMRGKRGVGHLAGDVDANGIDSATMVRVADWVICEFIRAYHALSLEEAQDLIDSIAIRELPTVWNINGKKRILQKGLSAKKQTLLLLYSDPSSAVLAEDLCEWVEYNTLRHFRRDVLSPLHAERLIEFDKEIEAVYLSPTGAAAAEEVLRSTKVS